MSSKLFGGKKKKAGKDPNPAPQPIITLLNQAGIGGGTPPRSRSISNPLALTDKLGN